jgi:hypothetical protein
MNYNDDHDEDDNYADDTLDSNDNDNNDNETLGEANGPLENENLR